MGICASKSQAKTVIVSKTVETVPAPESQLRTEERKDTTASHRKKYIRSRKKTSPNATERTEEHEIVPLFGHQLMLSGAPSPPSQNGFEDKLVSLVSDHFSLELLARAGIGCVCKKGLKPDSPNQDDFCVMLDGDTVLLGVFDGHGPCGHQMSDFVHLDLPKLIVGNEELQSDPVDVLKKSFLQTNERLKAFCETSNGEIDCSVSGTTASLILMRGDKVYVAHVGDSRIVMGRRRGEQVEAVPLTIDHKPTLPAEQQRIELAGGEVRKLPYDIPYRVFIKGTDDPGLSMSRSIGDSVSQSIGVICDPEVSEMALGNDEEFILLCSDGVWEFIESTEAVDLVAKFGKASAKQGAEKLAQLAWMRWLHREGEVVDDITVVLLYLQRS